MVETSARLLQLLSLFQSRRYWGGAELAGRLGVTARTVRRDVDKLRSLGYPIHSAAGAEGGYQMGAGADMPPLLLDDDEAVAVAVGLRQLAGVEEASVRALAKMEQIMPGRLRSRVTALHSMVVTSRPESEVVDARVLAGLAGACRDLTVVRFKYRDHGGKLSARQVEPFRLVHTGRRWYLVAWDRDRGDWRTFRVDRLAGKVISGERFPGRPGPAEDLASFVEEGFWRAREVCRARVVVFLGAEEVVKRVPRWAGVVEAVDEGKCVFDVRSGCWEWMAAELVMLGADFLVTEPVELVEAVRELGARLGRAVGMCNPCG